MDQDVVRQSQFVYVNGHRMPMLSRLSYAAGEPFTVRLAFHVDPGEWVEWEFARDLLIAGLSAPAGLGDIRIRPGLCPGEDILVIELESPDGYALVEMSRRGAVCFVDATARVVPLGAETRHLDLDAVIDALTTTLP